MLVPPPVQQQIVQQAPLVAYVPARLAPGWKYAHWTATEETLVISFTKAGKRIDFFVRRFRGDCTAGRGKTFQLAGVKVYWNKTPSEQMAWRCVGGVRMMAVTSLPPNRFADVGLGRMAASGHRIPR
jgi:hypothetical protein